jgi:four helix bundle protein
MLRSSRAHVKGRSGRVSFGARAQPSRASFKYLVSHSLLRYRGAKTCHAPGEIDGLTSPMRRSAVSLASNFAEGQGRLSEREFPQSLGQARGSLLERQPPGVEIGETSSISRAKAVALMSCLGEVSFLHQLEVVSSTRRSSGRNQILETGNGKLKSAPSPPNAKLCTLVWLKTDVRGLCSGS